MSAAQGVIIVIAIGCVGAIVNAYQQLNAPPPPSVEVRTPPPTDPKLVRYQKEMKTWKASLAEQGIKLTWPYLEQNSSARIDLPSKVPITLADWDQDSETKFAKETYQGFVQARKQANVASPQACIIHEFVPNPDNPGGDYEEVARDSLAGPETSNEQPISLQ